MPREFLTVQVIGKGLDQKLKKASDAARKAAVRAINRAATSGRAEGIKQIRKDVNFKAGYLRERIQLHKATFRREYAVIRARARPTRLDRFLSSRRNFRPGAAAGRVLVKKQAGSRLVRGSFYVPLKYGRGEPGTSGLGIARRLRTGPGSGRAYKVLHSTSVHNAFEDVAEHVARHATEVFKRRYRQELRRELDRQ